MRRLSEILHYGAGTWASFAATLRMQSCSEYRLAAWFETLFGQRRTWDEQGRTMYVEFEPYPFVDTSKVLIDGQRYDRWGFVQPTDAQRG